MSTFNPGLSELGIDAWERCGKAPGELNVSMITSMRRSMNLVLSRWTNRGINLWAVTSNQIALVAGTETYSLPLTIIDMLDTYVRVTNAGSATDIIMSPMSREIYAEMPNKRAAGRPTQFWFNRTLAPTVTVWPVPDSTTTYTLFYFSFNQIADADPTMGTPFSASFPYRFTEAYTAALAAHLAMKYCDPQRAIALDAYAKECWDESSDEDREKATTSIVPDLSGFYQ